MKMIENVNEEADNRKENSANIPITEVLERLNLSEQDLEDVNEMVGKCDDK